MDNVISNNNQVPSSHKSDFPSHLQPSSNSKDANRQYDPKLKNEQVISTHVHQVITSLNEVQDIQRKLEFSIEDDLGRTVIKVVDKDSQEVIRQIPSDQVLEMARILNDLNNSNEQGQFLSGLILQSRA